MENNALHTLVSSNQNNELTKPQYMRLNLTKWLNIYAIAIAMFEIVFWYFLFYHTLVLNVVFILHQTFILVNTVKTRQLKSKTINAYNVVKNYNAFIMNIFCGLFVVDIIICAFLFNIGFASYDEYEKFFAYLYVLTTVFKIVIAKYNAHLISDLDYL
jgi:hypothetical protein